MTEALKHCMRCGADITSTFWLCANCAEELGLVDVSYMEWPSDVQEMKRLFQAWRRQERGLLSETEDIPAFYDWITQGEYNDDNDGGDELEGRSAGGMLHCARCGETFADIWPTWPASPRQWQEPVCPRCGATWYEDVSREEMRV